MEQLKDIYLLAVITLLVVVVIIGSIYAKEDRDDRYIDVLMISGIGVLLWLVILYIVHRINKRIIN